MNYSSSNDYAIYQTMKNALDEYKNNAELYSYVNQNYTDVKDQNTKLTKEDAYYEEGSGKDISAYTAERMAIYENEKIAYIEKLYPIFYSIYYVLCIILFLSALFKWDLYGMIMSLLYILLPQMIYLIYVIYNYFAVLFIYLWKDVDIYSSFSAKSKT